MSRPSLQWCKLYSRLLDDEDFRGMGLAERGVYVGLICHANRQEPRGTFSVKNMRDLANVVADGDEKVLRETLNYLCVEWLNQEGKPHLVREGDRLRFRTFEEIQRSPSEEPAAIKARKDSSKERRNGNRTEIERAKNRQERSLEEEGDKEEEKNTSVTSAPTAAEPEKKRRRITGRTVVKEPEIVPFDQLNGLRGVVESLDLAEVWTNDVGRLESIVRDPEFATTAFDALGVDYMAWQYTLPPAKRHKDRIAGFRSQVKRKGHFPQYQTRSANAPAGTVPIMPTGAGADALKAFQIVAAQLPTPEYNTYFGDVTTSQPDATTIFVQVNDKKKRQRWVSRYLPMFTLALHEIHSPLRAQLAG